MKPLLKTRVPLLLVTALLSGACHPSSTEDKPNATEANRVFINEQLSLLPYLEAPKEDLSLSEQFYMEWAFPIRMKSTGEPAALVDNCSKAVEAHESGQETVTPYEYQAFRQAVFMCYAAELVSRSEAPAKTLESFSFTADWLSTLPAELAPLVSMSERERILNDPQMSVWTDVSTPIAIIDQGSGRVLIETTSLTQELTVLAVGNLLTSGQADLLLLAINSAPEGSYAVVQLFLLTWSDDDHAYELLREF